MTGSDGVRRIGIAEARLVVRDLPGFSGYRVSADGRVFSLPRVVTGRNGQRYTVPGRELKQTDNGKALQVDVGSKADGSDVKMNVGAALLRAFIGPPPTDRHECCHENGDYRDNRLFNIRWGTRAENAADRDRHGTTARGERSGTAKLTGDAVREIRRRVAAGETQTAVTADFGVSVAQVCRIVNRKAWRHVK